PTYRSRSSRHSKCRPTSSASSLRTSTSTSPRSSPRSCSRDVRRTSSSGSTSSSTLSSEPSTRADAAAEVDEPRSGVQSAGEALRRAQQVALEHELGELVPVSVQVEPDPYVATIPKWAEECLSGQDRVELEPRRAEGQHRRWPSGPSRGGEGRRISID